MNDEFNDLFDIKADEKDISDLPAPKQNVLLHSIIRIVVLILVTILTLGLLFVAALDGELGFAILALIIVIAWFGIMISEAKNLKKQRKNDLAAANNILIIIAFTMMFFLTVYIATMS